MFKKVTTYVPDFSGETPSPSDAAGFLTSAALAAPDELIEARIGNAVIRLVSGTTATDLELQIAGALGAAPPILTGGRKGRKVSGPRNASR